MVALAGFFVLYLPAQQANAAGDALRSRAKSISLALAAAVAPAVGGDARSVNDRLAKFAEHSQADADLGYIVIRRPNNALFASYTSPALDQKLGDSPDLRRRFDAYTRLVEGATPIRFEQGDGYVHVSAAVFQEIGATREYVGTLTTGLSQESVSAARATSLTSALVVSAAILIVGVLVAWLVGNGLTTPIMSAAKKLAQVSSNLAAAARDQEASSAQEAAAVAETRRSMETLLDSAQQIADRSSQVLGNAERSTKGSQHIAERIGNLNELSEKVTGILATIMQVADKADLLALNASLEGTRAGEAGKGFALVAAEMRRLAENVMESVSGIRELMKDMRQASQAAVSASEEGTRSSTATTQSAREIALLTQEQRQATEQVIASTDEMGEILNITLDGIQRITASANQLTDVAQALSEIVNPSGDQARAEIKPPPSRETNDAQRELA
jgi:methyl-accepting chemotaxis protein